MRGGLTDSPVNREACATTQPSSVPELLGREPGAGGQSLQLCPGDLWVDAPAEPAIGAGDDILAANDVGVAHDPVGDDLGMLHDVGSVADDAWDEQLAVRKLHVFPNAPFMFMANIARLHRIGGGVDAEYEVDDVLQRNVG